MSAKQKPAKVTVYMVGTSHGAKDGDKREVSPEVAKRLLDNRLAISQEEAEARLARAIRGS